jgi:DNA (cytosine-5)-methyltransferase 1/putative restriction endonuclease
MKLVNLASLDPEIRNSGRRGLANASRLDRAVWNAFHEDWEALETESEAVFLARGLKDPVESASRQDPLPGPPEETTVERLVQARKGQGFFRRAVLASYGFACCMSGLEGSSLLLASHIKPWAEDRENRLNPSNGLCLSALHDRAFDQGLLGVDEDFRIRVSRRLRVLEPNPLARTWLLDLDGSRIHLPHRFLPDREFLGWHLENRFQGS